MTATTPFLGQEDVDAPSFVEHLLKAAVTSREQAAVQALVEEVILTNDAVRRNLVRQTDDGGIQFSWQFLAYNLHSVGLDESGRAFVNFILSVAWCGQTSLVHVRELDERRLAILLRAMVRLSGNDTLAITVRR